MSDYYLLPARAEQLLCGLFSQTIAIAKFDVSLAESITSVPPDPT